MDVLIILIMIAMMVVIFMFGGLIFIFNTISPLIPYAMAKILKLDLLLVFQKNGQLRLIPAKYESSIYSVDSEITPWTFIKKDNSITRIGDVQCAICVDGWGITINPRLILSIQELHKFGITNFERLQDQLKLEKYEIERSVIENRPVNEELVVLSGKQLRCNSFDIINFETIYDFASDITPTQVTAQIDDTFAELVQQYMTSHIIEDKKKTNWMMLFIIIGLLLIGLVGAKSMGYI